MDGCIFCKLVENKIPSMRVYETDTTIAFLELNPSAPGHTMVIHKKHGASIQDYSQEELGELMQTVKVVSEKIEKALGTDSITIGINHKEKRGVPHVHVHLIPRWKNDKGGVMQSIVTNKPTESRELIFAKLKKH